MGKASSSKKVARAARAGGSRRSGQRRPIGFPVAIGAVVVLGLLLVLFARDRRNADAFPRANQDHVHAAYDVYTCVEQAAATTTGSTTTTVPGATDSTTTTAATDTTTTTAPTSTTIAAPGDVPGEYQPPFTDAHQDTQGIHTHGDGLIHIHPFVDSAAGRNATLGKFLDQVGVSMTDTTLTLATGKVFQEGVTKCAGGKDGELQVAKWNDVKDAAAGHKPNQIFTSGFDKIRLGANNSFTIAFMPAGSTIPAKSDVAQRVANVSDLATTTAPASSGEPASGAPGSGAPASSTTASSGAPDTGTTVPVTTVPASTSSSGP